MNLFTSEAAQVSQPTPSGPPSPTDVSVDGLAVGASADGPPLTTALQRRPTVLANVSEGPGGSADDRLIGALAQIAPAA